MGLPFIGLALAGLAMVAGVRPARLGMLAFHLLISGVGGVASTLTGRALARRARRQRSTVVAWEVRLRRPQWVKLEMFGMLLWGAGLLAALPAAAGLSSVSVGVLLTLLVMVGVPALSDLFVSPVDLTFEVGGLLMHLGAVSFQVPWALITRVEPVGPDHYRMLNLHIADRAASIASATPATPSAFSEWTVGLAPATLARAIRDGAARRDRADSN